MATACKIGIVKENGNVECVICWRDGYPDAAGQTLANHYGTYEKAAQLIAGGHIFDLDVTVRRTHFQSKDKSYTEEECKPINYKTQAAFLRTDHSQRYTYLFKDGQWHIAEE